MEQNLFLLIPATFFTGVLTFLSPCTLPILPAYFAFAFQSSRQNIVRMTVAFFLGLATTMTLLGASATLVSCLLLANLREVTLLGGVLIIVFGGMSFFGKGFTGVQFQHRPATTVLGAYVYGATFALGWTTCIGPILGAVLTLLATQGLSILQGALLAFVYALGLGAPLIVVAAFFSRLGQGSTFWKILRGRGFVVKVAGRVLLLHTTGMVSGILLIGMGILLASGQFTVLTTEAQGNVLSLWVMEAEEGIRNWFGLR